MQLIRGHSQAGVRLFRVAAAPARLAVVRIAPLRLPDAWRLSGLRLPMAWLPAAHAPCRVNLSPAEPERLIESALGATEAGRLLLEGAAPSPLQHLSHPARTPRLRHRPSSFPSAMDRFLKGGTLRGAGCACAGDLLLKRSASELLHPDSGSGRQFWDALYGWMGHRSGRLCHSFRQWIVPGEVTLLEQGGLLHVVSARLRVQTESAYAAGADASAAAAAAAAEAAVGRLCAGADPAARHQAEALFSAQVLPLLEEAVNGAATYAPLRAVFLWRVVAEYALQLLARADAHGDRLAALDAAWWPDSNRSLDWTPEVVYAQYASSMMQARLCPSPSSRRQPRPPLSVLAPGVCQAAAIVAACAELRGVAQGEFALQREVEDGDYLLSRTYFHGGVDFRPLLRWRCVRQARGGRLLPTRCRVQPPGGGLPPAHRQHQLRPRWPNSVPFCAREAGAGPASWWLGGSARKPAAAVRSCLGAEDALDGDGAAFPMQDDAAAAAWGILAGESSGRRRVTTTS